MAGSDPFPPRFPVDRLMEGVPPSRVSLTKALGHGFADPALLEEALTHASAASAAKPDYERLEFLGDRVLGLVVADLLLRRFPAEAEGEIAKRHAALVCSEALTRIAMTIDLGDHLCLSEGEDAMAIRENPACLADALEAVIAALYLDGGLAVGARFIERHWQVLLEEMPVPPQDPKTQLQEWVQARGLALPHYHTVAQEGPDHKPVFQVQVEIAGFSPCIASGSSKRVAEVRAAAALLEAIAGVRS